MRPRPYAHFAVLALAACTGQGALELTLDLPSEPSLRPIAPTTVTVSATLPGESPLSNTAVLAGGGFTAGELPVGEDVQIGVVLRDVSNRIVGVGAADAPVDIAGDAPTKLTIPVRRPFVFASAPDGLHSFDPTLDPRDAAFQGRIAGISAPLFSISVGGDRLAVVGDGQVSIVRTASNTVDGSITIPGGARDAAAVPGTHKIVVAHATGISVVDLDTRDVATAAVGLVDKVTAGPNELGAPTAYGLIERVAPPDLPPPMGRCSVGAASKLVVIDIDTPGIRAAKVVPAPLADIAAAPDVPLLVGADPCDGEVVRIDGDAISELGTLSVTELAKLERAAVLAVAGDRIWAAGTDTATPACDADPAVACPDTASASCAGAGGIYYASEGASVVVKAIALDGKDATTFVTPARRETLISTDTPGGQHAVVLRALSAQPLDLVTLPGGQYVSVIVRSRYFIVRIYDQLLGYLLPCFDVTTTDWELFDLASSAVAQRVRTSCDAMTTAVEDDSYFQGWECDQLSPAEAVTSAYQPTSVGALFGAR